MAHFRGSLLAKVDKADVACHMVPMLHGSAENRVQLKPFTLQLHLGIAKTKLSVLVSKPRTDVMLHEAIEDKMIDIRHTATGCRRLNEQVVHFSTAGA